MNAEFMRGLRREAYEASLRLRQEIAPVVVDPCEPVVSCKRCAGPVVGLDSLEDTVDRQQRRWACVNPGCLAVGLLSLEMTMTQLRCSPVLPDTVPVSRRRVHAVVVA